MFIRTIIIIIKNLIKYIYIYNIFFSPLLIFVKIRLILWLENAKEQHLFEI